MLPHRRATRILNYITVVTIFCLFFLFLHHIPIDEKEDEGLQSNHHKEGVDYVQERLDIPMRDFQKMEDYTNRNLTGIEAAGLNELFQEMRRDGKLADNLDSLSGRAVVDSVNFLNAHYTVLNVERFGPVEKAKHVILIQVHSRLEYLQYLVRTLSKARGIEETLLVFSHDINVESVNNLVRNITFARVIQIFYPYNMQLFPQVFPGHDPRDCPEKITKDKAETMRCQNWETPDKYGNFRVAKFTQIKHHWWWKMNYVFESIVEPHNLEGWVLLLEEDHYVSPDFLHVLNKIIEKKAEHCATCELISLGFYLKSYNKYGTDIDRLGVHPWFSSKHNMGMALRADTWAKIKNCSKLFCTWDDYNWDWSLLQISVKCLPQRLRVIFTKAPRVLHVGDCGVHTHRCAVHNAAAAAAKLFEEHEKRLFPKTLKVTEVSRRMLKPSKENGGWGDARDHLLCLRNTSPLQEPASEDKGARVLDDLFAVRPFTH